jgi:hypothetical protein
MSEEDLEVLITLDDPGEEDLREDTFHYHPADNNGQPQPGGDPTRQTEVIDDVVSRLHGTTNRS